MHPALATVLVAAGIGISPAHALPASGLQADWRADVGVVADGSGNVSSWTDASPNLRVATAAGSKRPLLVGSNPEVGGLPTLRFTGGAGAHLGDQLDFDGSFMVGKDYTLFAVAGRSGAVPANFVLAGSGAVGNSMLILGYENATKLRLSQFGGDLDVAVPANGAGREWNLDTGRFEAGVGRTLVHNGASRNTGGPTPGPITAWNGARIGGGLFDFYYFTGDIAELVIYDRALSCDERVAVERELAERWSVVGWSGTTDDTDGDGVCNATDVCDGDDAILDRDGDGVCADVDLCLGDNGTGDSDSDGLCDDLDAGDPPVCASACTFHLAGGDETDTDCDGWLDLDDNCPDDSNATQRDADLDGEGDVCDVCPNTPFVGHTDGDLVCPDVDNCVYVANPGQEDDDLDGEGDACDVCAAACAYHIGGSLLTDSDCDGWLDGDDACADDYDPTNACGS